MAISLPRCAAGADSWYQRDRAAAAALAERDEGLDELHGSLVPSSPPDRRVPVAMEMP